MPQRNTNTSLPVEKAFLSQRFLYFPVFVPMVLNRLMMYSSLVEGQKTRWQFERSEAHIRKGITHDL